MDAYMYDLMFHLNIIYTKLSAKIENQFHHCICHDKASKLDLTYIFISMFYQC
jgi:hypothetical protein